MSSRTKRLRAVRAFLFRKQNGLCHWCGQLMLFVDSPNPTRQPENLCTLDHLFERHHSDRLNGQRGDHRYVAACRRCNLKRGAESEAAFLKYERRKRSGAYPHGHLDA